MLTTMDEARIELKMQKPTTLARLPSGTWMIILAVVGALLSMPMGLTQRAMGQLFDPYTQVQIWASLPYDIPLSGAANFFGPTTHSFTGTSDPTFSTDGEVQGDAFANFGTLRAKVELFGPAARNGSSRAMFSDNFTPGGGAIGTPDEMTFVYSFDGRATIDLNRLDPPPATTSIASAVMSASKFLPGQSGVRVDEHRKDLSGYTPVSGAFTYTNSPPPAAVTLTVPFVYGETFSVLTDLTVHASADNRIIQVQFGPYFERWGGGAIDRVVVDYFSTANLIAIVNQTNPNFSLTAESGTDYGLLITDTIPEIPEPTTLAILAICGTILFRGRPDPRSNR